MRQHDIGEYPSNPKRAALLHAVAAACRDSILTDRSRERREFRADAMRVIALDPRLHSRARHTQTSLIDYVVETLQVSRPNARVIVHRARSLGPQRGG